MGLKEACSGSRKQLDGPIIDENVSPNEENSKEFHVLLFQQRSRMPEKSGEGWGTEGTRKRLAQT